MFRRTPGKVLLWAALAVVAVLALCAHSVQAVPKTQTIRIRLNSKQCLVPPYVGQSGRSDVWNLHGNYFLVSNTAKPYVYLTTGTPNQAGALIARNPLKMSEWRTDITLEISKDGVDDDGNYRKAGLGMAFWFVKDSEYTSGSFFGREGVVDGAVVFLATHPIQGIKETAPFLGVTHGAGMSPWSARKTVRLDKSLLGERKIMRIQYIGDTLKVYLGPDALKLKEVLSVQNVIISPNSHFCVSAQTGADAVSSHRITRINTSAILSKASQGGEVYVPGEPHTRGSLFVWLFFILVVLFVLYYLYESQGKKGRSAAAKGIKA